MSHEVVCPHCDKLSNHELEVYDDGKCFEITCGYCHKEFIAQANLDIYFSTTKGDENAG